jgi:aryl-alcohol dehydrogenase-like predicted oxidoreductase
MKSIVLNLLLIGSALAYDPIFPQSYNSKVKVSLANTVQSLAYLSTIATGLALSNANAANAATLPESTIKSPVAPVVDPRYSTLGSQKCCKILNGMWQVSGAHGFLPVQDEAVSKMSLCADQGFTTFDAADIYGPAEEFIGAFKSSGASGAKDCQFYTKWVPRPGLDSVPKSLTRDAINKSLRRMKTDQLDLLQFHWWEYDNQNYYNAVDNLMSLQQEGKILNLGLTNIDSLHMLDIIQQGAPIVSNQVSFSVLDTRPLTYMIPTCNEKNVQILAYGTLLGGFISDFWLGQPDPSTGTTSKQAEVRMKNVSLRKYLPWIRYWGGWPLFQELLVTLKTIANKHDVSLSNVALRWVLDQKQVAGVIVGIRLGLTEHLKDNERVYNLKLDDEDRTAIAAVQAKSKPNGLLGVLGDCGWEYRGGAQAFIADPDRFRLKNALKDLQGYSASA